MFPRFINGRKHVDNNEMIYVYFQFVELPAPLFSDKTNDNVFL